MMSPNQSVLPRHMLSQLLRPYVCSLCHKTFQKQNQLTRHVKIHSDIRQHKCPYCGKAFLRSDNLKKHIRIHTGEKFLCQFCNRGFTDSSNLTKHIRTHTGEGRHRCKFCLKHFAGLAALQKHMQEHDEMPFAMNTPLVKTEMLDASDYLSCAEQNHSKTKELLQQAQILSSPLLLPERNQNPSSDKLFLEKTNSFSSDQLPSMKYQEPFTAVVSGSVKETINPIKDFSSGMQDDVSLLLKQFQFLPQKSPPCLTTEKHPTPSAIKIEKLTDQFELPNFPDFLQEQNFLDNSIDTDQDVSLWQCVLCPEEFSSYPLLLGHLKKHVTASVQTPEKWDHESTEVIEASSAEQLNCRYCEQVFTQQSELFAHMDLTLCKNCGKIFACGMLLEQHREMCQINWMDKEVINEYGDNDDNNNEEGNYKIPKRPAGHHPRSENLSLDAKNASLLLTTVKQEVIFSEIEDQVAEHQLSANKSTSLSIVDSDLSPNKALSPTLISEVPRTMKDNLIDSSRILTNSNIFYQEKTISDSNQEILTKTVSDNGQESQIVDLGFTTSSSSISPAEPLEDKTISVNPQMSFTSLDSPEQEFGQDIPDPTKDFSFNMSVFDAYKCAKAALNNPNSPWAQDFNLSSALSECSIQSSQIWCKNCRKHFQSLFEFREHLKFFERFFSKFSLKNSRKLEAVKNGLKRYLSHNSSVHLERNLVEVDPRLETHDSENAQNQRFQPQKLARSSKNDPLVFTCNYCHKTFARSSQLNRHRKIHLGIKNHRCTFCSKTFLRSDNLKKHIRIHLGIKQYACSVCKKRFTDSSNLVKHQRIHNTNRGTHSCNLCSRNFLNYQSLRKHMQTHTEEQTTPDECFSDTATEPVRPEIPQKTSNVRVGLNTAKNPQSKIPDVNIINGLFSELESSRTNQSNALHMNSAKKANCTIDKGSSFTDCNFDNWTSNSRMQCLTEPKIRFCSSDSVQQNQILLSSMKTTPTSKYKNACPSSEELSVYLKPHSIAAQSLGEQQHKTERHGSFTSSNQNEELENLEETQGWNHNGLYLNAPPLVSDSSAALKPEISEPSESSLVNNMFAPLTEQMKDNLTLDMVFGDKVAFSSSLQNQPEMGILERQQRCQESLSEISLVNPKSNKNVNTSTANLSPLSASCVYTKKELISENPDSELTASSACFTDNMTEDKLEMSAYYDTQTVPNNLIKPIAQKLQLAEVCKAQGNKLKEYSGMYGTFENSSNSTSDNSVLRNLAIRLH